MHLTRKHRVGFLHPTSHLWDSLACFYLLAFGNCQNFEYMVCRKCQHFESSFHSDFRTFFLFPSPSPQLLFSLNFSQNGNPLELPRAMPVGSLGVCLGSVVVIGDGVFLHRCKSRKPRSVMQNRLSGVATLELQVLAGSHRATQVTWQETRQIYNENLLSRLGSLGRFIESQMFSWNVLLLTNRHFLMEKNFLSETSSELCWQLPLLRVVKSCVARPSSMGDSVPEPLSSCSFTPEVPTTP